MDACADQYSKVEDLMTCTNNIESALEVLLRTFQGVDDSSTDVKKPTNKDWFKRETWIEVLWFSVIHKLDKARINGMTRNDPHDCAENLIFLFR